MSSQIPRPTSLRTFPYFSSARVHAFELATGLSTGLDFVSSQMFAVAGQHTQGGVHTSPKTYLHVVIAYAAVVVVVNLAIGRITAYVGYQMYSLTDIMLFAIGYMVYAESNNIGELAIERTIQGLGAGGLFSASHILVQLAAEPNERILPMLMSSVGLFRPTTIVPWICAEVLEYSKWRMILWTELTLVGAAWMVAFLLPPEHHQPRTRIACHSDVALSQQSRWGWISVGVMTIDVLLFLMGLPELRYNRLTTSSLVLLLLLGGTVSSLLAIHHLRTYPDPWLDLSRLNDRHYLWGIGFYDIYYLMSGYRSYLFPVTSQDGPGLAFRTTMLFLMISGAVSTVAAIAMIAWLLLSFRKRRFIAIGFAVYAIAVLLLTISLMPGTPDYALLPMSVLEGIAPGAVMIQVVMVACLDLDREDFVHGYQMKNIACQLATTVGAGPAAVSLQTQQAESHSLTVAHVIRFTSDLQAANSLMPERLASLSAEIDRRAMLLAGTQLFNQLVMACSVFAVLVLVQRSSR